MPCNYSGYYDIASLKGFGYLQFDCARTTRTQLSCHCPLLQLVLPVLAPIVWPCAAAAPTACHCLCCAGTHPCQIPAAVRWVGSNRKDDWCQAKPMTCSESIANQSAMLHAADPDVKIGV
jgi:hypothetical protein